jgi:hypothetical protein
LFAGAMNATVGGAVCLSPTLGGSTKLNCTTSAVSTAASGASDILVTDASGHQALGYAAFFYDGSWPRYDSVFPTGSRTSGAAYVQLTGLNFNATFNPRVYFGSVECGSVAVVSTSLMSCRTGTYSSARSGSDVRVGVGVTVVDSLGRTSSSSSPSAFTYAVRARSVRSVCAFGCSCALADRAAHVCLPVVTHGSVRCRATGRA